MSAAIRALSDSALEESIAAYSAVIDRLFVQLDVVPPVHREMLLERERRTGRLFVVSTAGVVILCR